MLEASYFSAFCMRLHSLKLCIINVEINELNKKLGNKLASAFRGIDGTHHSNWIKMIVLYHLKEGTTRY